MILYDIIKLIKYNFIRLWKLYNIKYNKIIIKSNAAIKIAYLLGGFFKIFIIFKILPNFIRDGIYDVISRNRYRWFGKSDSCYIPKKEILDRFIND